MQHKLYRLVSLLMLVLCGLAATAQQDSLIIKKYRDTVYRPGNGHINYDSLHRKINIERKKYYASRDSLKRFDSLNMRFKHFKPDSAFKRLNAERKQLYALNRLKTDSAFKKLKYERKLYSDTIYKKHLYTFNKMKLDSGYKKMTQERLQYLKNLKTDSVRMQKFLKLKTDSMRIRLDSTQRGKKYNTKEISVHIDCRPDIPVFIKNNNRNVIIKKVKARQVSIVTTINYTDDMKFTDMDWFKKMAIYLKQADTGVVIEIEKENVVVTNAVNGINIKRPVIIEVPEKSILNVETKNAGAKLENDMDKLAVNITNGSLKIQSAADIVINGKYSVIKAEVFKNALIRLTNCTFTAQDIDQLNIDSKYSVVNIANTKTIDISSTSDQYRVDEVAVIRGKKDFGKLFLDRLNEQLVLNGANTDVNINNIDLNTTLIKVDSKYADLKFPVYDLKNYNIRYEGSSRSVSNVYTATQKGTGTATISVNQNIGTDTTKNTGKVNQTLFEASAGNTRGRYTKADIKCAFCNVVFN